MKTVLIGLGMVAEAHLAALADLKDIVHLKGIYARSNRSIDAFAPKALDQCGHDPHRYSSLDEIADDENLDFAIVATPPNARQGIVEALLRHCPPRVSIS